jgi:hypothetical protein
MTSWGRGVLLLVSGATKTVERYRHDPHLGILLTPQNGNSVQSIVGLGLPWACDNGCFTGLDVAAYLRMLLAVRGKAGLLWVTAPDVVADSAATAQLWTEWRAVLRGLNLPLAYVAQDGVTEAGIPWDEIACLFVGGSTEFKESSAARRLMLAAKRRGKWVHVGRINSWRRLDPLVGIGALDSFDGGQFSRWPDVHVPRTLKRLASRQLGMEEMLTA